MASSGTITISTQSVDYNGGAAYTRGAITLTNVIGWSVSNNGVISFSSISSSNTARGYWGVCTTSTSPNEGYVIMDVQVNYGGGWQTVASSKVKRAVCPSLTNTITASKTCINNLGTPTLTADCSMRILYYADLNPHPSSSLPNAFPSESYSAAVQVPVHVDVSWAATLKYNANGGSGAPADQTFTTNAGTYSFTIPDTVPTRTNYRFEGWDTNSAATVARYHAGDTFTISKSNPTITLYAIWTEYYRVGDVRYSGTYRTTNRSGGKCHIRQNGDWVEMRSIDAGHTTPLDPPNRRRGGQWENQYKIGAP